MKMDTKPYLLLALGVLGGCAGYPLPDKASSRERCYSRGEIRTCTDYPAPSRQQVDDVRRLRPPHTGVSRLILVRNDWQDAYGQAQVMLDGEALPALIPCSVVGVDLQPGAHLLHAGQASTAGAPMQLTLRPQEVHAVKVKRMPRGTGPRGFSLQPLAHAEALALIQECAVVGFVVQSGAREQAR